MSIAEQREKQKEALKKAKDAREKQLRNILIDLCGKAEGILFIRHLMKICGYQKTSIVGNPQTGDLQERGTFYNEARRNVYLEIRRYIPSKFLKKIEF